MRRMKVWDLPVRLFHWMLAVLIFCAWATQEWDRMKWHKWAGYTILTLLLFRLVWGFVGSDTAKFGQFLRSPLAALQHLARLPRREADREIGHNAAGGWMVLVMLGLVLVQAATGLCANNLDDGGDTEGPLVHLVGKDRSDWLSHIHALNFNLIEAVIVLHVLAILLYAVLKRQDLVRPMVTGTKLMPTDVAAPRIAGMTRALFVLAAAAVVVAVVVWV